MKGVGKKVSNPIIDPPKKNTAQRSPGDQGIATFPRGKKGRDILRSCCGLLDPVRFSLSDFFLFFLPWM
jgi:hypothetical protein